MDVEQLGRHLGNGLRARTLLRCKADANDVRLMWLLARNVRQRHEHLVGSRTWKSVLGSTRFTDADLDDLAAREVAGLTGTSLWHAAAWVRLADRLCGPLTATLAAIDAGRLDLARGRVLVEETSGLPDALAVRAEKVVLDALPAQPSAGTGPVGPWDGPSPRTFTARVRKAVAEVRTDAEEQVRADVRERTGTWVQIDPANPALATLTITGPSEQVVAIADTIEVAARGLTAEEAGDRTLGMVKVDLVTDAVTGNGLTTGGGGGGGVRRELGVVLHADTLLADGPAQQAAGEVRGVGAPVPASAGQARVAAGQLLDRGAGTCVLLADDTGHLVRILRIGAAPEAGWDRAALEAATRQALARSPEARHETSSYEPTVEIVETVRARDPVCTFPGCGVPASRCDLDHTIAHPRGPTSVTNLGPRSRRCHRLKTADLWRCRTRTRTRADGTIAVTAHEWTSPLGTRQVVQVEPLPGYLLAASVSRRLWTLLR